MKFRSEQGSFTVDILFLLPLIGLFIVFLKNKIFDRIFGRKKKTVFILAFITLGIFWLIGGMWYLDLWKIPSWLSSLSGNDFMWNWPVYSLFDFRIVPVTEIPTYFDWRWNLFALYLFFLIYSLVLFIWIGVGYLLLGRSDKQSGVIDLLFPRHTKHHPFN